MAKLFAVTDGKIVEISINNTNKQSCCIAAKCFTIDNQIFKLNCQMHLAVNEVFQNVNIVTCHEAVEHLTGLRRLFIVIQLIKPSHQFKYYIASLTIDHNVGKIVPLKEFTTSVNMRKYFNSATSTSHKQYCRIVDGPSLFWLSNDKLHTITSSAESETSCILNSTELLHPSPMSQSSKLSACCLLWANLVDKGYMCLGIQSVQYVTDANVLVKKSFFAFSYVACRETNSQSGFVEIGTDLFLPKEYAENVSCMKVTSCQKMKNSLSFDTELYAVTKEGYLMEFVHGKLLRAVAVWNWALNFVPPVTVDIFMCSSYHASEDIIFLQTDQEEVVAVNETAWKVCDRWNGIQKCFVGDFVDNGCDQILMLKDIQLPSSSWILTDLHTVHIENSANGTTIVSPQNSEMSDTEASTQSAIRALELRQQSDLVVLYDAEEMVKQQAQFLKKTWMDLQSAAQGKNTRTVMQEPSLLRLIEGQCVTGKPDIMHRPSVSPDPDKIEVLSIWQRCFADKWAVGLDVMNHTDKFFQKVTLSMVPKNSETALQDSIICKSVCYYKDNQVRRNVSESPDPYHPFAKRKKRDSGCIKGDNSDGCIPANCLARLICITNTPRFGHLDCCQCWLMLRWVEIDIEDCGADLKTTQTLNTGNGAFSFCCGDVTLSLKDVLMDRYTVRVSDSSSNQRREHGDVQKDLDVLNACQLRNNLIVHSACGQSMDLNTCLRQQVGFQHSDEYNCFVISQIRRLANTRLIVSQAPRGDSRLITACTCDEDELYMLVHHLYSCLADDVLILLDDEMEKEDVFQTCLTHLTEELQFLYCETTGLVKAACKTSQTKFIPASGQGDASIDVEKIRSQFAAEKSSSDSRCEARLDEEQVKKFLQKYKTVEAKTDFSISKLFSMH